MTHLNPYADKLLQGLKKYKYVLLVLLLGLALMMIPSQAEPEAVEQAPVADDKSYAEEMEQRLQNALTQIEGVGRVEVTLTLHGGSYTHYHSDVKHSRNEESENEERKTVILSEGSAYDKAAITTIDYPRFQGALIVCEGGANATVRLRLTEAVAALTGLSSERITVVKMK